MSQAAPANPPQPPAPDGGGAPTEVPGEVLPRKFGKYTLLRRLATGGMAELFLALHRSVAGFEKLVVIKRILPDMAKDQGFITMLLQEARIAATFSHPNIVTIFDVGQVERTYFIAMEHIHGEDLRSVVRAMKPKSVTEFPLEHAIGITLGVAAGLAYAHEKRDLNHNPLNIVHRDISPQNVLVTFTGDVKVVDFGIAKATQAAGDAPEVLLSPATDAKKDPEHHTKVGQLKGKVPYMSPEQARGEPLDGRSDIFSLGVMLFELATGRRLFRGPNEYETIRMITEGEYPKPSAVNPRISARLEGVIMKALAKDRERRYQNAREMQGDLESVVREERIPVSTLSLGSWMQMLFEEKLATQREALLQGKQLADVIAAEEPDQYTAAGTAGGLLSTPAPPPSKTPWIVAVVGILAVAGIGTAVYLRGEHQRATAAEAQRAVNSGSIEVHSVPEGASIWINDGPTPHHTPYTLTNLATGATGHYVITLRSQGYSPFSQEVSLAAAHARASVSGTLVRARAESFAVLEVSTTPGGATVLVDGRAIQGTTGATAPLTVPELAPGVEHTVLVRMPDYQDETFTFVGQAGSVERRPLVLRERPLAANEAFVNVSVEPAAAVLRVGEQQYTSGSPYHVRVHTGPALAFAFSAPGYVSETRMVRVRGGETRAMEPVHLDRAHASSSGNTSSNGNPHPSEPTPPAVVDRRPGTLTVGSTPWCNVTIDGQAHGQTPVVGVELSPGSHTVVCNNPEHGSQTRRVNVPPGGSARERFTF